MIDGLEWYSPLFFCWFVASTYTVIAGIVLATTEYPTLSEDAVDQPNSPSNTLKD